MTEREKHIEMAQRLGLVGMRPHLDGIYIDALAAFAKLVADDARATPALPHAMRESDEDKYRATGMIICIWDEMLAAAKEKQS